MSEEDRQKSYIFSSFFYTRLTDKDTPLSEHLQNSVDMGHAVTQAEIRHSRVRTWTRNVDLFTKDYILIPLNIQ